VSRRLRVLVLMHELLVPPDDIHGMSEKEVAQFKCEYDVCTALAELGHQVTKLGVYDELAPLRRAVRETRPHVVFNLLEEFKGRPVFDHNVVGYLELMGVRYTGNNPRGLVLARDKVLTKKILHYHRIDTPRFAVFPRGRKLRAVKRLRFPLIVKSATEEASAGISQASIVRDADALAERVTFVHERVRTAALAEEYVEGRELYAGVLGNQRLQVLPVWELKLDGLRESGYPIASYRAKWDLDYQDRHEIMADAATDLSAELTRHIRQISKRAYRALELSGYARLDFRLREDGRLFLLEANPNADISRDEELASAASAAGLSYEALIQKVVNLGLSRGAGRYAQG
jgi:D-alanine-D-alanine ligase